MQVNNKSVRFSHKEIIMKKMILVLGIMFVSSVVFAGGGHDSDGMITIKSANSVKVTLDKLEAVLKKKGITIAVRWSHSDNGNKVGIPLRPTELLIFGNPKLGTNMFTSNQTSGIDLPMKALAWEDEKGQVWLTYNDPAYIAKRHNIKDRAKIVAKMTGALGKLTGVATKP